MYYLERQQGEKFHNWARRVHTRHTQIRNEIYDDHKYNLKWYLFLEKTSKRSNGTSYDYTDCLNRARALNKENYPIHDKIIENEEYPRSIIKVQQYIKAIQDFDLLTELRYMNHYCDICEFEISTNNFFSDQCTRCNTEHCAKCEMVIGVNWTPFHVPRIMCQIMFKLFPHISFTAYMECKKKVSYKDWCEHCIEIDFSARIMQYYWRQYKNKQQRWQDGVIYEFIDKMINYNINKGALFHALTISKAMDLKTVIKMQSVMNVYK